MVGADMSLEGLVLAKGLLARWIVFASESLVALMGSDMSSKTSSCEKTLGTLLPRTLVLSFVGVRAFDVCLQMLVLEIRLITVLICAYEGSFIRVYLQVGLQSNWSIE